MKTIRKTAFYLLLTLPFCWVPHDVSGADRSPVSNNGRQWRIGYYEGGPFSDYTDTMRTLIEGLIELGWIEPPNPLEIDIETPKPYWDWLTRCHSPYLSFGTDDAYSAGWDAARRRQIRRAMMQKLKVGALDLVIAMGTWAGQDLANHDHAVPTLVLSTSNPVKAGIIKSGEDSGYDHVTARVDPHRYVRQLRMFHRIVGFDTLGVAYENTAEGRIYSAISELRRVSGERGFEVVTCDVIDTTADTQQADRSCMDCFDRLVRTTDAVYVTALTCVDRRAREVADIFQDAGIPSFAMVGSKFVKEGMMLSISSDSGYRALGRYNAAKFGAILNGARPGGLEQVFEDPLQIAVNMQTVRQIGFRMPGSILRIASEIFEQ